MSNRSTRMSTALTSSSLMRTSTQKNSPAKKSKTRTTWLRKVRKRFSNNWMATRMIKTKILFISKPGNNQGLAGSTNQVRWPSPTVKKVSKVSTKTNSMSKIWWCSMPKDNSSSSNLSNRESTPSILLTCSNKIAGQGKPRINKGASNKARGKTTSSNFTTTQGRMRTSSTRTDKETTLAVGARLQTRSTPSSSSPAMEFLMIQT